MQKTLCQRDDHAGREHILYDISDDTEDQQNNKLRDPDRLITGRGALPRSDIIDIGADHAEQNDRQRQKNDGIIVKGRREIQTDERHEHARNAASGTLKAREQTHGTRDPDIRKRNEYVIRKSHEKQDTVSSDHSDQSFFHANVNGFQSSC